MLHVLTPGAAATVLSEKAPYVVVVVMATSYNMGLLSSVPLPFLGLFSLWIVEPF